MTTRVTIVASSLLLIGLIAVPASDAQPATAEPEIAPVAGDLFRLRVGNQNTVFLATAAGILLVDPLSLDTAQWLKEELPGRFPPGDVKYVVHTNHRVERAEGASMFQSSADIVGHSAFNSALSAARREGPVLNPTAETLRVRDRDGDGQVTAAELYLRVRDVKSSFDGRRVTTLGGHTIEMAHAPTASAPENIIVNFQGERTAFASDAPPLDDARFTFGAWEPADLKRWLAAAAALDFDNLLLADGTTIPKARISRLSSYVDSLIARVADEYEGGRSADQFTQAQLPQPYRSDTTFQDWRANVDDVYRHLSVFRLEATVGGLAHYTFQDASFCESSSPSCSTGGMVPAATGSVSAGFGRWAGVGELLISDDSLSATTSRFVDEEFALKETRASFMMRYTRPAGSALSYRFLGGWSYTIGDRRGMVRIKEGLPPFAGRHPLESRSRRFGLTGGLDLVAGRRLGIVVPVRFNYSSKDETGTFPNRLDAQVGVSLMLRLFRSIG